MKKLVIILLVLGLMGIGCTNNRELTNAFLEGFLMGLSGGSQPSSQSSPAFSFTQVECDSLTGTCYIYKNGKLIGTCQPECWGGRCYCW